MAVTGKLFMYHYQVYPCPCYIKCYWCSLASLC